MTLDNSILVVFNFWLSPSYIDSKPSILSLRDAMVDLTLFTLVSIEPNSFLFLPPWFSMSYLYLYFCGFISSLFYLISPPFRFFPLLRPICPLPSLLSSTCQLWMMDRSADRLFDASIARLLDWTTDRLVNLFVTWWIYCLVSWLVWLLDLSIDRCGDGLIRCWVIRRAIHLLVYLSVHWFMWWCGDWLINCLIDWSSDPFTRLLNCSLIYPFMQLNTHSFVCSSIDPQNDYSIHG